MKYTIHGFSQAYALTLKKTVADKDGKIKTIRIDCTDLLILRWFVDFFPRMIKSTIDGEQYALVTHGILLEDLPLLDITKRSCIDRMQKLVSFGLLSYRLVKQGGTFSYYGFGKNYSRLVDSSADEGMQSTNIGVYDQTAQGYAVDQHRGMQSTNIGVCSQPDNKYSSINNNSIISSVNTDNNTPPATPPDEKKEKEPKADYNSEFEELWEAYPRKEGKKKACEYYVRARKNGTTFDQVMNGINDYCRQIKAKGTSREYIKQGSTWFGNECWNDEYDFTPRAQGNNVPTYQQTQNDPNATDNIFMQIYDRDYGNGGNNV